MKILVITGTFPPYRGGIGNAAYCEAKALVALGHSVKVITPAYPTLPPDNLPEEPEGLTVLRLLPLFHAGNAAVCRHAAPHLRNNDLTYLHYPFFGMSEYLWLHRTLSRPTGRLMVRYHMDVVGRGVKRFVFGLHTHLLMPRILNSADKVIFSSFDYARHSDVAGLLSNSPGKCVEIPFGVDGSVFYPDSGGPKDPGSLLFVGGLDKAHYFKGLDHLFRALVPLANEGISFTLTVVGQGDLLSYYQGICQQLGLARHVQFMSDCDNQKLRGLYARSMATLLPSVDKSEAFGIALLESMACGTAIIASNLPGIRTLVRDGWNGYRVGSFSEGEAPRIPPYRTDGLTNAVRKLLQDPELARQMGQNALEFTRDKYNWTTIARQVADAGVTPSAVGSIPGTGEPAD